MFTHTPTTLILLLYPQSDPVEEKLIESIDRIEKEANLTLERVLKADKDFSSLQQVSCKTSLNLSLADLSMLSFRVSG